MRPHSSRRGRQRRCSWQQCPGAASFRARCLAQQAPGDALGSGSWQLQTALGVETASVECSCMCFHRYTLEVRLQGWLMIVDVSCQLCRPRPGWAGCCCCQSLRAFGVIAGGNALLLDVYRGLSKVPWAGGLVIRCFELLCSIGMGRIDCHDM